MSQKQFLYLATDGRLLKIGITNDPARRMVELGNLRIVKLWRRTYARALETAIKGILAYAAERGSEWFNLPLQEALFEVERTIRIEDDDRAIQLGVEPSPRPKDGKPPYDPPFELARLASC